MFKEKGALLEAVPYKFTCLVGLDGISLSVKEDANDLDIPSDMHVAKANTQPFIEPAIWERSYFDSTKKFGKSLLTILSYKVFGSTPTFKGIQEICHQQLSLHTEGADDYCGEWGLQSCQSLEASDVKLPYCSEIEAMLAQTRVIMDFDLQSRDAKPSDQSVYGFYAPDNNCAKPTLKIEKGGR